MLALAVFGHGIAFLTAPRYNQTHKGKQYIYDITFFHETKFEAIKRNKIKR